MLVSIQCCDGLPLASPYLNNVLSGVYIVDWWKLRFKVRHIYLKTLPYAVDYSMRLANEVLKGQIEIHAKC